MKRNIIYALLFCFILLNKAWPDNTRSAAKDTGLPAKGIAKIYADNTVIFKKLNAEKVGGNSLEVSPGAGLLSMGIRFKENNSNLEYFVDNTAISDDFKAGREYFIKYTFARPSKISDPVVFNLRSIDITDEKDFWDLFDDFNEYPYVFMIPAFQKPNHIHDKRQPRAALMRVLRAKSSKDSFLYQFADAYLSSDINLLTELLTKNTMNWRIFLQRGLIYHEKEDYVKAAEDYEQAIALNPSCHEAYFGLGKIYAGKYKDYKKSNGYYRKAMELGGYKIVLFEEKK
jgi:tetratricopeptide (TPR) repeat protein